jgi:hypothetical protein
MHEGYWARRTDYPDSLDSGDCNDDTLSWLSGLPADRGHTISESREGMLVGGRSIVGLVWSSALLFLLSGCCCVGYPYGAGCGSCGQVGLGCVPGGPCDGGYTSVGALEPDCGIADCGCEVADCGCAGTDLAYGPSDCACAVPNCACGVPDCGMCVVPGEIRVGHPGCARCGIFQPRWGACRGPGAILYNGWGPDYQAYAAGWTPCCGPILRALHALHRCIVCAGCGPLYFDEWISDPPYCHDPCPGHCACRGGLLGVADHCFDKRRARWSRVGGYLYPPDGIPIDEGMPIEGMPAEGLTLEGMPVEGVPVEGIPVEGVPGAGGPGNCENCDPQPTPALPSPQTSVRRRPRTTVARRRYPGRISSATYHE